MTNLWRIEAFSLFSRNSRVERPQRRVLPSIMKASSWATKFVSKYLVVEDVLQNSVEIRVLVSSAVKWVTGPGRASIVLTSYRL
jgi:hypothetical protein